MYTQNSSVKPFENRVHCSSVRDSNDYMLRIRLLCPSYKLFCRNKSAPQSGYFKAARNGRIRQSYYMRPPLRLNLLPHISHTGTGSLYMMLTKRSYRNLQVTSPCRLNIQSSLRLTFFSRAVIPAANVFRVPLHALLFSNYYFPRASFGGMHFPRLHRCGLDISTRHPEARNTCRSTSNELLTSWKQYVLERIPGTLLIFPSLAWKIPGPHTPSVLPQGRSVKQDTTFPRHQTLECRLIPLRSPY